VREQTFISGSVAVDPASLAAGVSGNTDVTVPGLTTDMVVFANPAGALDTGLAYQGCSVPAADTLRIRLANFTAGAVNGASLTWNYLAFKSR
jgi:hypothetical protein